VRCIGSPAMVEEGLPWKTVYSRGCGAKSGKGGSSRMMHKDWPSASKIAVLEDRPFALLEDRPFALLEDRPGGLEGTSAGRKNLDSRS